MSVQRTLSPVGLCVFVEPDVPMARFGEAGEIAESALVDGGITAAYTTPL